MIASEVKTLSYYVNGEARQSQSGQFFDIYDPSTGQVIARTPRCTTEEVNQAIQSATEAYPAWAATPAIKRSQVLFKFRDLLDKHLDELTHLVAQENGKVWDEAMGDVLKAREAVEFACGIPTVMMGESMMNATSGYDTVLYREPLGVFAGIAPFNFPIMIPMGWMIPICIATGNTMVLKAASWTPMSSMRALELLYEAGLPKGVVNLVTCSRNEADLILKHPDVKGVIFVGSTSVGLHVYTTAAANGKRVQALTEAKNHALVLADAPIERAARGIINAAFGCAGERCMALPTIAVEESVADQLVELLVKLAGERKIGPAYDKTSELGPLVTESHRKYVLDWIEKGIQEGAKLVLDGRGTTVKGYEEGFYLGPCIFDHVKPGMTCGDQEIFGPVLVIKRVKDFEEGLAVMNANEFANGSVIFTQSGYYAREFARRTDGGMVGINVGIPVPVGMFPFAGHKRSFFGDVHALGKDGMRFFTESKCVTSTWFSEEEMKKKKIDTWDGVLGR
jgi:malonate-semialdehyde dehydrogenase (acetylating) / methylmalonate-semialdehyde dehydrogenase